MAGGRTRQRVLARIPCGQKLDRLRSGKIWVIISRFRILLGPWLWSNCGPAWEVRRRSVPFRRKGHVEDDGEASTLRRSDPRSQLMRKSRARSATRFGTSIAAPSKRRHKKFRKLSRASSGGAPASPLTNWRRRCRQSWLRGGRQRRSLHDAAEFGAPLRRAPAVTEAAPGRSEKLRGRYHIRALRARWRVAPASRARFRSTAKRSGVAAQRATASGLQLIDETLQKVQQLKDELGGSIWRDGLPKSPAVIETVVEIISSPSHPIQQNRKPQIEQARATPPLVSAPRDGGRSPIGSTQLEWAITEAVKKEGAGCEAIVGVIVQRTRPQSRFDANWAVRGVKFGKADRDKANEAVATIVERLQREFRLADD
jgi:hypothetical protein